MRNGILTAMLCLLTGGAASAQTCLHGPSERPGDRSQREQALRFAAEVNAAEFAIVGARVSPHRFRPLTELKLPLPPPGFSLQLQTDGETYSFSLKDTLDPCYYAIFSDQDRRIYEAMPRAVGTPVPIPPDRAPSPR